VPESKLADATRALTSLQREAEAAKADQAKAERCIDSAIAALLHMASELLAGEENRA
jgi:hypothetical protein